MTTLFTYLQANNYQLNPLYFSVKARIYAVKSSYTINTLTLKNFFFFFFVIIFNLFRTPYASFVRTMATPETMLTKGTNVCHVGGGDI